jgi:hypothetical protein
MALATAQTALKAGMSLWIKCSNCDHRARADLPALVARGWGSRPLLEIKFKCTACGSSQHDAKLSSDAAENYHEAMRWGGGSDV